MKKGNHSSLKRKKERKERKKERKKESILNLKKRNENKEFYHFLCISSSDFGVHHKDN